MGSRHRAHDPPRRVVFYDLESCAVLPRFELVEAEQAPATDLAVRDLAAASQFVNRPKRAVEAARDVLRDEEGWRDAACWRTRHSEPSVNEVRLRSRIEYVLALFMETLSARFGSVDRGRKISRREQLAHLPEQIRDWTLDDYGAPAWISAIPGAWTAPWATIVPRRPLTRLAAEHWDHDALSDVVDEGPLMMPAFIVPASSQPPRVRYRTGRGRPPLEAAEPEAAVYAAFLADVAALGERLSARRLKFMPESDALMLLTEAARSRAAESGTEIKPAIDPERSPRHRVARHVRAGRRILHDDGVLPWAVWPCGEVPDHWAHLEWFQWGLTLWYRKYVTRRRSAD